jgi:acetyl-CoA carboxylase biotin carboxylase subunit
MDSAAYGGYSIPPHYDSLIGKLIIYGRDRDECLMRMKRALNELVIDGIESTIPLFKELLEADDFNNADYDIHWLEHWLENSTKN